MGVREVPLREEIGEDPHHVVAELALVAVDTGVERIAAPRDLGGDEAALVGVDQCGIRNADLGDSSQLGVPIGAHVREVLVEPPGGGEALGAGPGGRTAETVGDDHVVVVNGVVRRHGVGCSVERYQRG